MCRSGVQCACRSYRTKSEDFKRQCEWAGEMFEQGAFLNHMLSRYHGQIRQTPWTVLNSPCVTREDLRAATACHFSTYLRPLALLFLRGDVAVGGRGARAVRPVLWHDLEPLTLTQQHYAFRIFFALRAGKLSHYIESGFFILLSYQHFFL